MTRRYADAENLVKQWLDASEVAPLVTRADGGRNLFLAMPASAPLPAVVLSRVGGGPAPRSDIPEDRARISFHCWASSRAFANALSRTLTAELDHLGEAGGYSHPDGRLYVAEVLSWLWLPDPESDTPRYIVDALFVAVATQ